MSKRISLLTINVSFKRNKFIQRMENISAIIDDYKPDIVALQEVTQDALAMFLQEPWSLQYYPSTAAIDDNRHYGEVIFSMYPIMRTEILPFNNTKMNRCLNVVDLCIPVNSEYMLLGHTFTVATAHLESLDNNDDIRRKQLLISVDILDDLDNVFLMGDTNFKNDNEFTSDELPEFWKDAWEEMINMSVIEKKGNEYTRNTKKTRQDRIYYKSLEWTPIHYECKNNQAVYMEFEYGLELTTTNEDDGGDVGGNG